MEDGGTALQTVAERTNLYNGKGLGERTPGGTTMAWETRNGRGRYYTRSRRVGGRVLREYVGSGLGAELTADLDEDRRASRAERASEWRAERERLEAADQDFDALCRLADSLMRAELIAAGYHQHARGAWRKRRGTQK
jgi:hypothetical protein